jgi:hypothetical protein
LITDGQFDSQEGSNPIGLYVTSGVNSDAVIRLSNCSFAGIAGTVPNECVWSGGGTLSLTNCNFRDWNQSVCAIGAVGGYLTVEGCNFAGTGYDVSLTSTVAGAVITNNTRLSTSRILGSCANSAIANNVQ